MKLKRCGVYKIQSRIKPERVYIGSSCDLDMRWRDHILRLKRGVHHAIKLQRHFDKYGEGDFVFSIIALCDRDDLIYDYGVLMIEQCFIWAYKPYFNSSDYAGLISGHRMSEEQKERMRNRKVSDETRKRSSESHKGKPSPNKGVKMSDERKIERYFKMYGRGLSCPLPISKEEKGRKISASLMGKKLSAEHKEKLRKAKLGKKRGAHPQEVKDKIGKANKERYWNKKREVVIVE